MAKTNNIVLYPFPEATRPDASCTQHLNINAWLCFSEDPPSQGQIKVAENDVWQTVDHGFVEADVDRAAVFITGDETSEKGFYRVVTEIISNNAVRLDRPWDNAAANEGIPTDWVRLHRDAAIRSEGLDVDIFWDPFDGEEGRRFAANVLRLTAQDVSDTPIERDQFINQLNKLVIQLVDNIGGSSVLRQR